MINPFKETNWHPGLVELRNFARSLVIGFPVLALVFGVAGRLASGHWKPGLFWMGAIGCALGLLLWLVPWIARPFYLVWYFASCCLGIVMSNVLVAVFFALLITPTALIMRLLGRDSMARRFDPAAKSYWRGVEKVVDPGRYFRQF